MSSKDDLSLNLCECYVFGGVFQWQHMPISNPVSIIYGFIGSIEWVWVLDRLTMKGDHEPSNSCKTLIEVHLYTSQLLRFTPISNIFIQKLYNSFRLTTHQISIVHEEYAITSLPHPYYTLSQQWPSKPQISLYLHGCLTHRGPPHSLTAAHPTCYRFSPYFLNNWSKFRWKLLQGEATLNVIISKCWPDCHHCVGQVFLSLPNRRQWHAARWWLLTILL